MDTTPSSAAFSRALPCTEARGGFRSPRLLQRLGVEVLVRDAAASSTYLVDPHDRSTRIQLQHLQEDNLPSVIPFAPACFLIDHTDPADLEKGNCLVTSAAATTSG